MERLNRYSAFLMLWPHICVGSSPLSVQSYTSSKVGLPAVLPCTVASHLESELAPHIQWQTVSNSVFERMGQEQFQGEAYIDRVDVPENMLVRGNCSLFLEDVRFSDAGIYKSYLVIGEPSRLVKRRIFLQSVQLVVVDHKAIRSVQLGSDLILNLHTHQAEQVVFQSSNNKDWRVLWEREGEMNKNCHLKEEGTKLVLRSLSASSAGTYKVLDSQGLALSTVKVTITDPVIPKESEILQIHSAFGKATISTPPLSLITLLLMFHCLKLIEFLF